MCIKVQTASGKDVRGHLMLQSDIWGKGGEHYLPKMIRCQYNIKY